MSNRYIIRFNNGAVEMTKPNSTMIVYKIPYENLETHNPGYLIPNKFIVYILFGKNSHGKDMIYVGKSKNGIDFRPTSHKDKYDSWTTCYVLTQFKERTFFNDGTIQYLEDEINHRVREVDLYQNTTVSTTSGTANTDDKEDCDDYLAEAYKMLNILGLDLITNSDEEKANYEIEQKSKWTKDLKKVPDGIYYFSRKRSDGIELKGEMRVKSGTYTLLKGSDVFAEAVTGLSHSIDVLRNKSNIENGKLMEDVEIGTPSGCGEFIIGTVCNGWTSWRNDNGDPIDIYRK